MKKTCIVIGLCFASFPALAQQRGYTFSVTTDEANVILDTVGGLPWKNVNPLMQKLIGQANEQSKPAIGAKPPKPLPDHPETDPATPMPPKPPEAAPAPPAAPETAK